MASYNDLYALRLSASAPPLASWTLIFASVAAVQWCWPWRGQSWWALVRGAGAVTIQVRQAQVFVESAPAGGIGACMPRAPCWGLAGNPHCREEDWQESVSLRSEMMLLGLVFTIVTWKSRLLAHKLKFLWNVHSAWSHAKDFSLIFGNVSLQIVSFPFCRLHLCKHLIDICVFRKLCTWIQLMIAWAQIIYFVGRTRSLWTLTSKVNTHHWKMSRPKQAPCWHGTQRFQHKETNPFMEFFSSAFS